MANINNEPQKLSMELPSYDQYIYYFSSNGYVAHIHVFFNENKNYMFSKIQEGKYSVIDNKLIEVIMNITTASEYTIDQNTLSISQSEGSNTEIAVLTKMDNKDVKQYLDKPKTEILGAWLLTADDNQYYKTNTKEYIYKIFYKDGKLDLITAYTGKYSFLIERLTVLHGTWSFKDFILHEDFKGHYSDDFLIS